MRIAALLVLILVSGVVSVSMAEALPPRCLGHIGYAVVPWKQRLGYAACARHVLLPEATSEGLRYVEITTDPENIALQRVIGSSSVG